ncbi:hypothetical protein JW905_06575 [bacterium]|nr:hypothetical protein [candidate division CSSED10-310 bacterium]
MKKMVVLCCLTAWSLVSGLAADAADVHYALGIESMYLDWERPDLFEGSGWMYGPRINIRWGQAGLSARYLVGEFDLDEVDAKPHREDLDIGISYSFHPHFSALIMHKRLGYELKDEGTTQEQLFSILGIGIGTSTRIADTGFYLSATIGYLPLIDGELKLRGAGYRLADSYDTTGYSADLGAGWAARRLPVSISGGVRYLKLDEADDADQTENTFRGAWLGFNLSI